VAEEKPADREEPPRQSATRIWLVAATITATLLAAVGTVAYYRYAAALARIEDQYSRRAAHLAEEVDLRVESYRRVAEVLGNVIERVQERLTSDQIVSVAASRGGSLETDPQVKAARELKDSATKAQKAALGVTDEKIKAADAAVGAASTALEKQAQARAAAEQAAKDVKAAAKELEEASRMAVHADAALQNARSRAPLQIAPTPSDAADSGIVPVVGMAAVPVEPDRLRAELAAAAAAAKLEETRTRSVAAKAKWEELDRAMERASQEAAQSSARAQAAIAAVLAASAHEVSAVHQHAAATRTYEDLLKIVRAKLTAVEKAEADARIKALEAAREHGLSFERQGRKCFTPGMSSAAEALQAHRCYAQAVARELLKDDAVQPSPEVVACPVGAAEASGSRAALLLSEQFAHFRIPVRAPGVATAAGNGAKTTASTGVVPQNLCLRVPVGALVSFGSRPADKYNLETRFDEVVLAELGTRRVLEASGTSPEARLTTLPEFSVVPGADAQVPFVDLGAERYRVFQQPVRSRSGPARDCSGDGKKDANCEAASTLVVVGLVKSAEIHAEVRRLSPIVFLAAVALAALAVFSWPLAKLWLIGARAPFSRFDSAFLATSALAGTFIVTILTLTTVAYERLTQRLDDILEPSTRELAGKLSETMVDATIRLEQLALETKDLRSVLHTARPAESSTVDIEFQAQCGTSFQTANWRHREDDGLSPFCETVLPKQDTAGPGSPWSLSFWANAQGQEQIQFYSGERGIPPVNVGNRRYFREALEACAVSKTAAEQRVVPEVTRSMTRTQKVVIVARATCAVDPKEGESGVAAVVQNVKAFTRLAPVPGTQWAIIDDEGTVMLHSNLEEHHGHNIFEDLDADTRERVASAMVARASESFDGDFRGARSRFHVRPEAASGWYVVGIGSRGHDHAVLRNTLLTTLVTVVLFVLGLALVIMFFGFLRRGRDKKNGVSSCVFNLRPHADGSRAYASAVLGPGAASLGLLFVALFFGAWIPTLLLAIAAGLLIWFSRKVPGVWPARPASSTPPPADPDVKPGLRDRLTFTYPLCCFAFACASVVVPTTISFVGAFKVGIENTLKLEQRASVPPPGCAEGTASSIHCPKLLEGGPRLASMDTSAPRTGMDTSDAGFGLDGTMWLMVELMKAISPDFVPRVGEEAPERPFVWQRSYTELKLAPVNGSWFLTSEIPHLFGCTRWLSLGLWISLIALLMTAAHAIAYLSLKRLFFMKLLIKQRETEKSFSWADVEENEKARALVLFPPPGELPDKLAKRWAITLPEDRIVDPKQDEARLRRVEAAAATPDALILAECDPLRHSPPGTRARWIRALAEFTHFNGPGTKKAYPTPANEALFARDWDASDEDEQRVLARLAFDGHASPHPSNGPVLRHLVQRGLVDSNTLTISDDRFADFVRCSVPPEKMYAWEKGETDVAWSIVRVPLIASVTLIVGLVSMSRPEITETGALLVPPIAGGLPAVLRLVAAVVGSSAEKGA
jgi:hypothetical protein